MQHPFPVAKLTENDLKKLKQFEEDFRAATGEEIVLIAYDGDQAEE